MHFCRDHLRKIPAVFVMLNFCYLIFSDRGWSLKKVCKPSMLKEA
jgi:hypothetical protein